MRRAKSKFRPAVGGSPAMRSPALHAPTTPESTVGMDDRDKENQLWVGPDTSTAELDENCLELSLVPVDGNEIEPPDALDEDEDIDEALFKFKVPPPESGIVKKPRKKKELESSCSSSNRSSRAEAIMKRKKAEENLQKNTADGGTIDRTEVSMSDLIFVGSKIGTHEMGFSRRLREQREAKERATSVSQLSGTTKASTKSTSSERFVSFSKPVPQIVRPKVRVVDGKIVLDKCSLNQTIDEAPDEINDEILDEFDAIPEGVNSLSFRSRKTGKRSKNWSEEETDRFYEAITIVGNDFVALSSAFARRNASEIKRKFIRENKQNSRKIDELLQVHATGQSNWDLTHLREKDAQYYKALDDIEEKKKIKREKRLQRQLERQENNNQPKKRQKTVAEYVPPKSLTSLDDLGGQKSDRT